MNKLFESAVAAEFRQRVRWTPEISVDVQDNSHFLGTLVDGERVEPAFRLKPDLILRHGAEVLRIADTKWKRVRLDGRRHLVPDEEDVCQMLAYAAAFGWHDLQLIPVASRTCERQSR